MSIQLAEFSIPEILEVLEYLCPTNHLGTAEEGPLNTLEYLKENCGIDESKDSVVIDTCDEIYLVGHTIKELRAFLTGLSLGLENDWAKLTLYISTLEYDVTYAYSNRSLVLAGRVGRIKEETCANVVAAYLGYAAAASCKKGISSEVLKAVELAKRKIADESNIDFDKKDDDFNVLVLQIIPTEVAGKTNSKK